MAIETTSTTSNTAQGRTGLTRRGFLAALAVAAAGPVQAGPIEGLAPRGSGGIDHSAFSALLGAYVVPDGNGYNRVAYRAFARDGHGPLKRYLAGLQAARPSGFARAEALAYWINLYNAATLDVVLDHYPVRSIKEIRLGGGGLLGLGLFGSGPWAAPILSVEGEALSLDDVEHRIVRPIFGDPMTHYALNCASYSCPNLAVTAYTGDRLGRMMEEVAAAYVNHPRGVDIGSAGITASRIYSWYAADFGGRAALKPHWQRFSAPERAAAIGAARIAGYAYDWRLNDAR